MLKNHEMIRAKVNESEDINLETNSNTQNG